jgi:hypothetical protein
MSALECWRKGCKVQLIDRAYAPVNTGNEFAVVDEELWILTQYKATCSVFSQVACQSTVIGHGCPKRSKRNNTMRAFHTGTILVIESTVRCFESWLLRSKGSVKT